MIIRFFAQTRILAGQDSVELPTEGSINGERLWHLLILKFPQLDAIQESTRLTRNHEYISRQDLMDDADEIALIPPVSGG